MNQFIKLLLAFFLGYLLCFLLMDYTAPDPCAELGIYQHVFKRSPALLDSLAADLNRKPVSELTEADLITIRFIREAKQEEGRQWYSEAEPKARWWEESQNE